MFECRFANIILINKKKILPADYTKKKAVKHLNNCKCRKQIIYLNKTHSQCKHQKYIFRFLLLRYAWNTEKTGTIKV